MKEFKKILNATYLKMHNIYDSMLSHRYMYITPRVRNLCMRTPLLLFDSARRFITQFTSTNTRYT